jgi:hypothetical protein
MKIETQICEIELHFDSDEPVDLKTLLLFFDSQKLPRFNFNFLILDQAYIVDIHFDGQFYLLSIAKVDCISPAVWRDFSDIPALLAHLEHWLEMQKTKKQDGRIKQQNQRLVEES